VGAGDGAAVELWKAQWEMEKQQGGEAGHRGLGDRPQVCPPLQVQDPQGMACGHGGLVWSPQPPPHCGQSQG